jgi:dTDP-4-amino-4,6-dideoxygalactose transaminase
VPFDIPFIRPVFPSSAVIGGDFDEIVESNWYTNFGPRERRFSAAVAAYIGDGFHAVTFANATIGLLATLQVLLGRGDNTKHVVIPSFTFAAGAAAIQWAGYIPLLIDIDRETLQPSLEGARAALASRHDIAGILLCNTFGIGNAAVRDWETFADEAGLPLILDSAAGFGSRYVNGARVGTAAKAEVFSFHATKPFAIGEGGAVVTRDGDLAAELASFQNFGFSQGRGAHALGLNGKLQEINAAIGLRQLEKFDHTIANRQRVLAAYQDGLRGTSVVFPTQIEMSSVCFASILFDSRAPRDRALEALLAASIEVRTYYSPAVHLQPHFERVPRQGELETTEEVADVILSVPVHQSMSTDSIDRIVSVIRAAEAAA